MIARTSEYMENKLPTRKKNRLEKYDYSSVGAYFITVCTLDRKELFWDNSVGAIIDRPQDVPLSLYGKIVDECIKNIFERYEMVSVDYYVIMPDHIHLLIRIHSDKNGRSMVAPTVGNIVRQFKGSVTKRIGRPIWQKSFYDHIVRNSKDYDETVKYIYENPMRWVYENKEGDH